VASLCNGSHWAWSAGVSEALLAGNVIKAERAIRDLAWGAGRYIWDWYRQSRQEAARL